MKTALGGQIFQTQTLGLTRPVWRGREPVRYELYQPERAIRSGGH